ncbi:MAG: Hsp20/alpha crystallin family protein [Spirochaetaceae bacterium]|jgi:HSP20 family molecular chaperone IbpA|nr:Hsp20/alpha crystallin family protein [Spirochaetaceae bacterium]
MRYLATKNNHSVWNQMDSLMNQLISSDAVSYTNKPAVDIREEENSYFIDAELPGYSEEEVEVKLEDNLLTLSAEKKSEIEDSSPQYLVKERNYRHFKRSFVLPRNVDQKNIQATFEKGILTLELAKKEEAKAQTIMINKKK